MPFFSNSYMQDLNWKFAVTGIFVVVLPSDLVCVYSALTRKVPITVLRDSRVRPINTSGADMFVKFLQ